MSDALDLYLRHVREQIELRVRTGSTDERGTYAPGHYRTVMLEHSAQDRELPTMDGDRGAVPDDEEEPRRVRRGKRGRR